MVGLRDLLVAAPTAYHHHDHQQQQQQQLLSSAVPLLTATPIPMDDASRPKHAVAGIHFWQPQPPPPPSPSAPNPNPNSTMLFHLRKPSPMFGGGGRSCTCEDCGNQAKKGCSHRRCRTCCKGRGFDCTTHVRSTWIPAARRRERHLTSAAIASTSKKPRVVSSDATTSHTSTTSKSNNTPPRSIDTTSSHQDARFRERLPGHVRAPAVFKSVRVTSIDDGEDEYVYQAAVRIGGHVFKGFLYDQGVDQTRAQEDGNNSGAIPNLSELNLGGANGAYDLYGGSSGAAGGHGLFGGATPFGNQIN